MGVYADLIKDIITNPNEAFSGYDVDLKDLLVIYAIGWFVYAVGASFLGNGDYVISVGVFLFFMLIGETIFTHIFVKIFGKSGLFKTFKILTFSFVPLLVIGWIPIIGLISLFLSILIMKRGLEIVHGFSNKKAIAITIITFVLPLVIIISLYVFSMIKIYSMTESTLYSPEKYMNIQYTNR